MKHAFHPETAREFIDAIKFYRQRGPHLGKRFDEEIRTTISRILATPHRWKILEEDMRRCLVRVFPYSVIYTVESDYVLIIAIAHGKRRQDYWHNRLMKRS